jgi:hypothetical protein
MMKSSVVSGGGGAGEGAGGGGGGGGMMAPAAQPSDRMASAASLKGRGPRKLSVPEMMAERERGGPQMSLVKDANGRRLTNAEARARMPAGGYVINTGSGLGGGGRIGSAAGAKNSKGTPTSDRGKALRAFQNGAFQQGAQQAEAAGQAAAQAQGQGGAQGAGHGAQGAQTGSGAQGQGGAQAPLDAASRRRKNLIAGGAQPHEADQILKDEFVGPPDPATQAKDAAARKRLQEFHDFHGGPAMIPGSRPTHPNASGKLGRQFLEQGKAEANSGLVNKNLLPASGRRASQMPA